MSNIISAFMLALVCLSGCAHLKPAGDALKACELASIPAEMQGLAGSVASIALDPGSSVADLEQLAVAVGSAQFKCVVQAVQAFLAQPAPAVADPKPPVAQALVMASADVKREHAQAVLAQYLAAH